MEKYQEVYGNLLTQIHEFDVIAHGCNCFNMMAAGIAGAIAKLFPEAAEVDRKTIKGSYNKLGTFTNILVTNEENKTYLLNCYTQFHGGANLDLTALRMCMNKINHYFKGKKVGLPLIGAGIAGGDWNIISQVIKEELVDCYVTIVKLEETKESSEDIQQINPIF